jgi:hypothetical protein
MHVLERLSVAQLLLRSPPLVHGCAAWTSNTHLDLSTCSGSDTAALSQQDHRVHRTTATTLRGYFTIPRFRLLHGRDPLTWPAAAATLSLQISVVG